MQPFGATGALFSPWGQWSPLFGAHMGPNRGPRCLGPIWAHLGPIFCLFGVLLGPFGAHLEFWPILAYFPYKSFCDCPSEMLLVDKLSSSSPDYGNTNRPSNGDSS